MAVELHSTIPESTGFKPVVVQSGRLYPGVAVLPDVLRESMSALDRLAKSMAGNRRREVCIPVAPHGIAASA